MFISLINFSLCQLSTFIASKLPRAVCCALLLMVSVGTVAEAVKPMSAEELQKLLKPKENSESKPAPTVTIKGFVLEGVEEYPDYDVGAEQISTLVNDLYASMGEQLSLSDLQKIAKSITDYYRTQGFLFARAYIPKQKLKNGIVKLSVNEGVLSAVDIRGNKSYDTVSLMLIFQDVIGQSVQQAELESRLTRIRQLPGVQIYSYFSAGLAQGETRLNIVVREEKVWSVSLALDNHGSDQTGQYRMFGQTQIINLFKDGDRINLGVLYAANPTNNVYGYFNYFIPFFDFKQGLEFTVSGNQFDVGRQGSQEAEVYQISGDVYTTSLKYQFNYTPSSSFSSQYFIEGVYKVSEVTSVEEYAHKLANELVITGGLIGSFFNYSVKDWDQNYYLGLDIAGLNVSNEGISILPSSVIVGHYDASVNFFRLPLRSFVKVGVRGQIASNALPSVEQFGMTGSQSVRAYEPSLYSTDNGMVATTEWVFQPFLTPEIKRVMPFLFVDYSMGEQIEFENIASGEAEFVGAGIGVQYQYKTNFQTYITWGFPLSTSLPDDIVEDDYGSIVYAMMKVNY